MVYNEIHMYLNCWHTTMKKQRAVHLPAFLQVHVPCLCHCSLSHGEVQVRSLQKKKKKVCFAPTTSLHLLSFLFPLILLDSFRCAFLCGFLILPFFFFPGTCGCMMPCDAMRLQYLFSTLSLSPSSFSLTPRTKICLHPIACSC